MDQDTLIKIVQGITWPGAVAISIWQLTPVFQVLLSKIKTKNGENTQGSTFSDQIKELNDFKQEMETNHNTDLSELMRWRREIVDPSLSRMDRNISYIRGKMGNGGGPDN